MQIEDSWRGKLLRRWHFHARYCQARARWSTLRRLEPILQKHFRIYDEKGRNDWISHVQVRLRAWPGSEDRELRISWPGDRSLLHLRFLPWREQECRANWNSPITVRVFKKGKDGGKPVVVRYMSFFVKDRLIYIAQLQGVRRIEMPPGLRDWAERMLRACIEFAREQNFRGVRVAQAESQYSYHHPYVHAWLSADERTKDADRVRERMRTHLDGSARALGWPLEGEWFKWDNPDYRHAERPTSAPSPSPVRRIRQ